MNANCNRGELAISVQNRPYCDCNIGRIAKVYGPPALEQARGLTAMIVHVDDKPLHASYDDVTRLAHVRLQNCVEHPDSWLLPARQEEFDTLVQELRGMDHPQVMAQMQAVIDEYLAQYLLPGESGDGTACERTPGSAT